MICEQSPLLACCCKQNRKRMHLLVTSFMMWSVLCEKCEIHTTRLCYHDGGWKSFCEERGTSLFVNALRHKQADWSEYILAHLNEFHLTEVFVLHLSTRTTDYDLHDMSTISRNDGLFKKDGRGFDKHVYMLASILHISNQKGGRFRN